MSLLQKTLIFIGFILFLISIKVFTDAYMYLDLSFESGYMLRRGMPDDSFLWKASFITHIVSGSIALIACVGQFFPRIRSNYPALHKRSGITYIIAVMFCSISGIYSCDTGLGGPSFIMGLKITFLAWMLFTLIALFKIKVGEVSAHQNWMLRSVILATSILSWRALNVFFIFVINLEYDDAHTLAGFAVFINIIFAEWLVRNKMRVLKS